MRRFFKGIAWLLGGVLACVVVAYLALLAINWRDQPPSDAALKFAALYKDRPQVPDDDNGYVYALGFGVAPDADPRQAGLARIAWLRSLDGQTEWSPDDDPVTEDYSFRSRRGSAIESISEVCGTASLACADALDRGGKTVDDWLSSEQWLLDRYLRLLKHPG